ncbi:response regulator [Anaeromyxobacter paludicola]|uniref:DNA-binding response regulator n=1 Tax=Anaeromyxobacter paludicola TaxID=2918171 RepID=A0ABN6N4A9_9BACT|nr:response regulator transcription factor [Anaeromyxobacter paludicola]BDG07390.1 DNA-binding response regulator [Anaeromyxobacter paludicola]
MSKIRVLIADDHAILREGVRALLKAAADVEVVGEAADGLQAIEKCRELEPDVVLMDIAMPGLGGIEAALELKKTGSRTRVLVMSQYEDREYVRRMLKAGAAGYVLKKSAGAELANAIRAVARGGLVLDPEVARAAVEEASPGGAAAGDPYEALTDREKQVLKLVAEGKSNKEVAELLGISVKTAMSHRERVMEKLDVHNRTELVRFALKRGVIRVDG